MTKTFHFSKPILIVLSISLLFVGSGLGALVTYNVITNEKDKPVYFFDPTKNSKFSIITTEKEPNNTFDQATKIIPGYEVQGTFSTSTDVDIYSFNLDNPADVQITLKNLPKEYNTFIYDANKLLIASSLRAGFKQSSSMIALNNPGKYYIKLVGKDGTSSNINYPYTIMLNVFPFVE